MNINKSASRKDVTILIVDDFLPTCKMVSKILDIHGYTTLIADNGLEAIEVVLSQPVDIVLLDVMMPDMNGIEVCRKIKGDPLTAKISVILFTASTDPNVASEGALAGADGFIPKPFNVDEFIRYIDGARSKADKP
jgi:two-component system cell cycle response regulator